MPFGRESVGLLGLFNIRGSKLVIVVLTVLLLVVEDSILRNADLGGGKLDSESWRAVTFDAGSQRTPLSLWPGGLC